MNRILNYSMAVNAKAHAVFEMLIQNRKLESWLTVEADVEPRVGGKFELFWNPEERDYDSTIGCRITAIERDKFLAFEWKGPKQFSEFMNDTDPLTHVVIFLIPVDENKTELHLIHSGWRGTQEWDKARRWFENLWGPCLQQLKKIVEG